MSHEKSKLYYDGFGAEFVTPTKWQLSPWGYLGGGFWVVAVMNDRALWYNDIENGLQCLSFYGSGSDSDDRLTLKSSRALEMRISMPGIESTNV